MLGEDNNYQGSLSALGTVLDSSWFVRVRQTDLNDLGSWKLQEAQLLRQGNKTDYVLGSQSTFWPSETAGQLWGMTAIRRWGFTPPPVSGGGAFNASQRLRADELGRSVAGEAEPGTLVQLTRGFGTEIFAETLVDSSGIYRFDNVPTGGRSGGNNYRLLLYPNGQLTAQPLVREATFTSINGQLPHRASALIVAAGSSREFSGENSFFDNFEDLAGAVSYRYGVSEDITLGVGTVYDRSTKILGEAFYQPGNVPLQLGISATTNLNNELEINSRLNWQPLKSVNLNLNSDRFGERFNLSWRFLPNLGLIAEGNTDNSQISTGIQASAGGRSYQISARVTATTDNQWRWNFNSRYNRWRFTSLGNEVIGSHNLNYSFASGNTTNTNLDIGHSLFVDYETNKGGDQFDRLTTVGWNYRSPIRSSDGRYLWSLEVGYGLGSQGNGFVTTFDTGIIPGLLLRANYQQVSPSSNTDSFRVTVSPFLNFQQGIRPDNSNYRYLRQQGGLLFQPFFDRNNNGKKDRGEKTYLEDPDLLLAINKKSLKSFRPFTRSNGVYVRLSPDTYLIDIDPAGFPLDWKASQFTSAVEVVAGSYTPVAIPLVLSYSISGVVTNNQNKPLGGAKVEAIPIDKGVKITSVTNGAGVFYLEGLSQGTYQLLINDKAAQPSTITIDETSEPFQEINLGDF